MSFTKRQIVEDAFGELALAGYTFDLTPDELQMGLRRIESMLRTWLNLSIDTGYIMPTTPAVSDLDDDSGMLDMYDEAVRTNGAIRIAASFGKQMPQSTAVAAKAAYEAMLVPRKIAQQQLPRNLPVGAGNRGYAYGYVRGYFVPCLPVAAMIHR